MKQLKKHLHYDRSVLVALELWTNKHRPFQYLFKQHQAESKPKVSAQAFIRGEQTWGVLLCVNIFCDAKNVSYIFHGFCEWMDCVSIQRRQKMFKKKESLKNPTEIQQEKLYFCFLTMIYKHNNGFGFALEMLSVEQSWFLLFANNWKWCIYILSLFQNIQPKATDVALIHNLVCVSLIYTICCDFHQEVHMSREARFCQEASHFFDGICCRISDTPSSKSTSIPLLL